MKKQDRDTVVGAIESHTERVSLDRLAAEGKSHVRVISGEKATSIIEAVVNQVISERTGVDRAALVREATERFEVLAREQAEAAARITLLEKRVRNRDRRLANARTHRPCICRSCAARFRSSWRCVDGCGGRSQSARTVQCVGQSD